MHIETFSGDFYKIGRQLGKIYSQNGMGVGGIKVNKILFENQLKIYKRYYPEYLQELKGMARAGGYDERKLIYRFICGELLGLNKGLRKACTIFGVKNKKGTFVGRNYDWIPIAEKMFTVFKIMNPIRNCFIAVSDMGVDNEEDAKPQNTFYNADDAINDKGLYIGLTFAHCKKWNYGLSCVHVIKLIAETCSSIEDALNIFERTPICCPKNFFIADETGKMVVVEHTSKSYKIINPRQNILVHTNHYIDYDLINDDTILEEKSVASSFLRYYEALKEIRKKKDLFDFADVIKIMGKKESSYLCQNSPNMKTIWTLSLNMRKREYKIYYKLLGKRKAKNLDL